MSGQDQKKKARDQRLDALLVAATAWSDEQAARLQKLADFSRKMVKGRRGLDALKGAVSATVAKRLSKDIEGFLT